MCLYNYNKENKKYKQLTYAERTMIETWYNQNHKSKMVYRVMTYWKGLIAFRIISY